MPGYYLRKIIRRLPGIAIKAVPLPEPDVKEGFGARALAGAICRERGYRNVLVVTDKTLFSLGYHLPILQSLDEAGINYKVFSDINSEPTTDIVEAGREAALEAGAEALVALGGGSVMDSTKMIAAGCRLKKINEHFLLLKFLFVPDKTLPIINIPSTAGTGAEITVGAVIMDTVLKTKGATVVVGLDVKDVILDSELTVKAPAKVTAACGIDALSHGLEGCVADVRTSDEDEWKSRECVRLVLENLPKVLAEPENAAARQAMCLAAHYGGNAINRQLAGYVHAFAHSLGGRYHIAHGVAIAACTMPVMNFQKELCIPKLALLARHCGFEGNNERDLADKILTAIDALIKSCGLGSLGQTIPEEDFHILRKRVSIDSINYSAPITLKDKDIDEILWNIQKQ